MVVTQAADVRISGRVADIHRAPLTDVTVTLRAVGAAGLTATFETHEDGVFVFGGIESGRYELTFEKSGFTVVRIPILAKAGGRLPAAPVVMEVAEPCSPMHTVEYVQIPLSGVLTFDPVSMPPGRDAVRKKPARQLLNKGN